ncbi:hypothetical protein [Fibrobacter sp. UWB10]|uniref:hypothetical protein n=1 Tax=Fibrobacter sp. UWB10 TaxID=1896201 RepID=UPI001B023841|nr:hypothetical protein [Fibrobacter sp. UWB10]MBO7513623.1 hypothetical protein [Fibrobacter sp.]SMP54708.1 hypothetical protein SAMN05720465_2319 [Fibrobacter sp. UWB10]
MNKLKMVLVCLLLFSASSFAAKTSESAWSESRCRFFLHAGLLDAGLGLKVRLSHENGVYLTFNAMWQSFHTQYFRVPAMIYLGGNNIHFLTGFTLINKAHASDTKTEVAAGLNWDFNEHWGLNGMMFTPVSKRSSTGSSLLLDVRYAF